jgi:hypothetical protein
MEEYKPLNQNDDQSEESQSYTHAGKEARRSLPRWALWFTAGFLSSLITVTIVTAIYTMVDKKGPPLGLIPDCKLLLLVPLK